MKVDKSQLIVLCKQYGAFIQGLPSSMDGGLLLWALSGVETSFGVGVKPRHEVEYCPQFQWHKQIQPDAQGTWAKRPGKYSSGNYQQQIFAKFECLACCSWGPWQIMAGNAVGYTPVELMSDMEKATEATIAFMNRKIATVKPQTLEEFATMWNGSAVSGALYRRFEEILRRRHGVTQEQFKNNVIGVCHVSIGIAFLRRCNY